MKEVGKVPECQAPSEVGCTQPTHLLIHTFSYPLVPSGPVPLECCTPPHWHIPSKKANIRDSFIRDPLFSRPALRGMDSNASVGSVMDKDKASQQHHAE